MEKKNLEHFTIRAPLYVFAAMLESAAVAASKKPQRPILRTVNVRTDETGAKLEAIATDSARLHRVTYDVKKAAADLPNNLNVYVTSNINVCFEPEAVAAVVAAKKTACGKNLSACVLAVVESDAEKVTFSVERDGARVSSCVLDVSAEVYPVSENIFPRDNGAFMSFDPSFMGDLRKAGDALNGRENYAVMMKAPQGPYKPFYVDYACGIEHVTAKALLTPMRTDPIRGFAGFDHLTKASKDLENLYINQLKEKDATIAALQEEISRLKKALEEKPAAEPMPARNSADAAFLAEKLQAAQRRIDDAEKLADELNARNDSLLTETAALTADNGEKAARIADLEEKYKALNATMHEKHAENIRLVNKIKDLEKALAEAQTATAPASEPQKKDGGIEPATERQRAYIAKLGGTLPDGATIRDASILITQLKKAARYSA